jgi:uracil-DNA glycosylase family 4
MEKVRSMVIDFGALNVQGLRRPYSGGAWRQQASKINTARVGKDPPGRCFRDFGLAFHRPMRQVARMDDQARQVAQRLLDWYGAVGVDEALCEDAIDWLVRGDVAPGSGYRFGGEGPPQPAGSEQSKPRQSATSRQPPARVTHETGAGVAVGRANLQSKPAAPRQFATGSPDTAVTSAREAARAAASLDELEAALAAFEGCALKATAKNLCFYRGVAQARVMLIGEAPGRDEDLAGKPFVGPAGRMLDKMLAAIGLGENDVHITNSVYWRPPGNRTPSLLETQVCLPFLERQVELVEPEVIVVLGGAAAKLVLGVEEGIMRLRGKWKEVEFAGAMRRVMPTLHPAFLLRTPINKRLAWRDLLAIETALEGR